MSSVPPRWRLAEVGIVTSLYLLAAVWVLWGIWSTSPTSTTVCACGDSARYLWFVAWPAWAISHGHGLFLSDRLFPPTGFNVLDDTSVLAFGVPLSLVTWVVGPVASLNVALTLAPATSALAMYVLLRRWVAWRPAAFVGGLAYGFGLWMLTGLSDSWLNFTLAIPPLLVACLDELLVSRRRSPRAVGVVLGLLVVVQFFLSTELLVIAVLLLGAGLLVLVMGSALVDRAWLARTWRPVATGLGVGVGVASVLLAYPVLVALVGPSHLVGLVWPNIEPGWYGITPAAFVHLGGPTGNLAMLHRMGGYQGPLMPSVAYLGWPLLAVLVLGMVLLARQARAWVLLATGLLAAWCSFTTAPWLVSFPVPFDLLGHIPIVQNILPVRFVAAVTFCSCALLALIADRVHTLVLQPPGTTADDPQPLRRRLGAGVAGGLVLAVAFFQLTSLVLGRLPMVTQHATVPRWFTTVGRTVPPSSVVLTYPAPFGGIQAPLAWQAMAGMRFAMAGGDGPRSALRRAGRAAPGQAVLADLTISTDPTAILTTTNAAKLVTALRTWGVTMIVIPDPAHLPPYDTGTSTAAAAALVAGTLRTTPRWEADAWVWQVPRHVRGDASTTMAACAVHHAANPGYAAHCAARG